MSNGFSVSNTPVVQNAAYASGNVIGGLQRIPFFSSPVQASGILNNVSIFSKGGSTTPITLYIFDTLPAASTITDKVAFALAAADVAKLITEIPIVLTPAIVGVGTTVTSASQQQPVAVNNGDSPTTSFLYVCAVVGGAVTPASVSDLVFTLAGLQDQ